MTDATDLHAQVQARRARLDAQTRDALGIPEGSADVWGLALSGGGIRSATFSLGVIRALADTGLLNRFDLLSTVSGGGYIGGMLGRLFTRVDRAEAVVAALAGVDTRWFLWWLRANGRYLVPRGMADTLFALAIYLRNLLAIHLELGIIALCLGCLLVGLDLGVWWWAQGAATRDPSWITSFGALPAWLPTLWLLLPLGVVAATVIVAAHWALTWVARAGRGKVLAYWAGGVLLTLLLLGYQLVAGGVIDDSPARDTRRALWLAMDLLLLGWVLGVPMAAWRLKQVPTEGSAALHVEAARSLLTKRLANCFKWMAAVLLVGLMDRGAWFLAFEVQDWLATGVAAAVAITVLRAVLPGVSAKSTATGSEGLTGLALNLLGYLMVLGLVTWWWSLLHKVVFGAMFDQQQWSWMPPVLVLAGVGLPALGYLLITGRNASFLNLSSLHTFYRARLVRTYLGAANARRFPGVDQDKQGALSTLPPRGGSASALVAVTQVDRDDDIDLGQYRPQDQGGPVHLINVCLNQTQDPRGQIYNLDRKGLSLSVASGGAMRVGTDPWQAMQADNALTLGTWVAISGAAVAPGMGAMTRGGMASLATLIGARLGYWWSPKEGGQGGSRFGKVRGLVSELMGSFGGRESADWFLSDGGHFENTAAYALLAARARVIVMADCGADPDFAFKDLENLVRKARIDLQTEILFQRKKDASDPVWATLNADDWAQFGALEELAAASSDVCLAVAKVVYDGRCEDPAWLIVVKPNVCKALPVDLRNYKQANPDFPQQSTADQFFSEAQWESYHSLGRFLGKHVDLPRIQALRATGGLSPMVDDEESVVGEPEPEAPVTREAAAAPANPAAPPASSLRGTRAAIASTISLSAAATVGVSAWQGMEGWRAAQQATTEAHRVALGELSTMWARLPAAPAAGASAPDGMGTASPLAAALVRYADTLCPSQEADWLKESTLAVTIYDDTVKVCKANRGNPSPACTALLSIEQDKDASRFPGCLSSHAREANASGRDGASFPRAVVYGLYAYGAAGTRGLWGTHPCDGRNPTPPATCQDPQADLDATLAALRTRLMAWLGKPALLLEGQGGTPVVADARAPEGTPVPMPAGAAAPTPVATSAKASPHPVMAPAPAPASSAGQTAGRATGQGAAPPDTDELVPAASSGPLTTSGSPGQPVPVLSPDLCLGKTIYVQIYGPTQRDAMRLLRDPWRELGASVPPLEDVRATATAQGRVPPMPVDDTTVRYHSRADAACAQALAAQARRWLLTAKAPGGLPDPLLAQLRARKNVLSGVASQPWKVEPLSATQRARAGVIEVWVKP